MTPIFQRRRAALDQFLQRYNPLRGLTIDAAIQMFDEAEHYGRYSRLMWLCKKVERRDEIVKALKARGDAALLLLDWDVKVPEDLEGADVALAERQRQFLSERYEAIDNLSQAIQFLALAEFRGFSHLEMHYGADLWPAHLEPVPQWHWCREDLYKPWRFNPTAKHIWFPRDTQEIDDEEARHFLIREVEDPCYEIFILRYIWKAFGDVDWAGYIERYGIPWFFFVLPPAGDEAKAAEFQEMAEQVAGDGAGALPHGTEVKGPPGQSVMGGASNAFAQYIKRQEQAQVIAGTGGLLTMLAESGSGTLAGGAHWDAWLEITSGRAKAISEVFQAQFDRRLLEMEFPGQPALAYFELDLPDEGRSRKAALEDAKLAKEAGLRVRREILENETGWEFDDAPEMAPPGNGGGGMLGEKPDPEEPEQPDPDPGEGEPLRNRFGDDFEGAAARDAYDLFEAALAEALDAAPAMLAPVDAALARLMALASGGAATAADFDAAAGELAAALPEFVADRNAGRDALAAAIEGALGAAAAQGVRARMRRSQPAPK